MKFLLSAAFCLFTLFAAAQTSLWKFVEHENKKEVDVLYKGKLMTSLRVIDSVMKPVLFPINTVSGITVTRGYPIAPKPGDHTDHPHHTGMWLNFQSVNGIDYWGSSTAIPFSARERQGRIEFEHVKFSTQSGGSATMEVTEKWLPKQGAAVLRDETTYVFTISKNEFIIDRITKLMSLEEPVFFADNKDGFLGFRVASELEQPAAEPIEFLDAQGKLSKTGPEEKKATGKYLSSIGLKGDSVWGTRARWCTLNGTKEGHPVSITIIDHPKNPGYPTYWHARGYGLFAANPLGQAIFSNGKEQLNLTMKPNSEIIFRFRIVIASEVQASPRHINELADKFAARY